MRVEPIRAWSAAISVSALVLLTLLGASLNKGIEFDLLGRSYFHQSAAAPITALARVLSLMGSLWILIPLCTAAVVRFMLLRKRRQAVFLGAALAGATVVNDLLKFVVHRSRPEPFFGTAPESFSFPSGHVAFSASLYGALAFVVAANIGRVTLRAGVWVAVALLVFAIGWSRIYLGVHYPTDVIAGLLVAIFWLSSLRVLTPFAGKM